ncbi:uncharacterized protein [Nicotiana sylvestris]|uniref:uncharacterized protein n=1 Tax=Nicotiana sylvestris TaxID=4096 RepID=UPI00388C5EC1
MGLNEVYVGVRSNLLMMQPPPTLDSPYNILLQDERQRQINSNSQFGPDSVAFTAKINLNHHSSPNTNYKSPGSNTQRQYVQRVNFDQAKGNLFCKYCKKSGHLIDKCFKLHGFPPDFKFTKGKKITANATIGAELSSDSSSPSVAGTTNNDTQGSLVPGLTKQQYSQLMAILQHSHQPDSAPQSDLMASANFARASDHMTYNKDLLTNITHLPIPYLVTLPNGYKVKVTCTGSFSLYHSIILLDVLYIPSFKHNLIFVHKLVLLLRCITQFSSDSCLLQGPSLKMPLELGKLEDGLYKFVCTTAFSSSAQNVSTVPHVYSFPSLPSTIIVPSSSSLCNSSSFQNILSPSVSSCNKAILNKMDIVWHQRLSHVPFVRMKGISAISSSLSSKQRFPCEICLMAR